MIKVMEFRKLVFVAFLVLNQMTTQVLADCTCEQEVNDQGKKQSEALKYKLIGLASIFSSGAIGVSIPFIGKIVPALNPNRDGFFVIKSLAAGVILATGFVHILPDAQESLKSPCLKEHPWADFPFAGLVAMVAAILTLLFETFSTAHQVSLQPAEVPTDDNNPEEVIINHGDIENPPAHSNQVAVHTHATHGHTHTSAGLSQVNRYRIISRVLELGIIVHSVIIGLSLGASGNPKSIRGLIIALSFHQFFEGMGLGGCIFQAQFTSLTVTMMGAFFSLTTPIGLAIGIAVTNAYKENSSTALIVEGILNAASAGILIYMALVDLLSPTFMNPRMQKNKMLYLCSSVSLLLGAGLMSLLAIWA